MKNKLIWTISFIAICCVSAFGQGYKQPAKEIMDVLNAPAIPTTSISPSRDKIAMLTPLRYPPIAELAEPMLRIAGLRINPNTNGQHRQPYAISLTLKNVSDGKETTVAVPAGAKLISPQWSPSGKYLAVGNVTASGVELWIVDTATAKATKVKGVLINTALGGGFSWDDSKTLSANLVPTKRGTAPAYQNLVPTEPNIQETSGRTGAIATVQDLLKTPNDERLFEYYCTSQLAQIDVSGKVREYGTPAIYEDANVSPDGKYVLVSRIERPFSYQFPYNRFPKKVEIWDANGKLVTTIAAIPLQDSVPSGGVQTGTRGYAWVPVEGAMLIWAEALDGGNPKTKVPFRDKLMRFTSPFTGEPVEVLKTEFRAQGRQFGEKDGLMLFGDFNRDTQRRRMFMTDYRNPSNVKLISDLNINDRYNDIGQPVTKMLPNGSNVVRQNGDDIFLSGTGASPDGDRPFLRRMNLKTLEKIELFRSGKDVYESFVALISDDGNRFITRMESSDVPPNLFQRLYCPVGALCGIKNPQITNFTDPSPQLRGIKKQLVKYKRADGVDLSFTLYLPPNYTSGTRLPAVVWAYPQSFTDGGLAGQVSGSTTRFTQIGGISELFFLLQGYAVMDDVAMPIVGPPETKNDTFVKQIVDSASAAIDKAVEMGVVDRDRIGVGGHSYGAFMTANLLAHSDLFRAGIARSGAYNRTLTPFGFQDETRNFWEATDVYTSVSPFFYANKINEPLLMTHGEADNNQGTYPINSERLFAAMSGLGGTAKLVMLPLEAHGYAAKESTEHTLYEMVNWFDKYVKNAKPRVAK